LRKNPTVAAFSAVGMSMLRIDGVQDGVMGLQPVTGSVTPPLARGRLPQRDDEIALGGRVLRAVRKHVGDTVVVRGPEQSRTLRIVGQVVLSPKVMNGQIQLGGGGVATLATVKALNPDEAVTNLFLVRFTPGVTRSAGVASLEPAFPAAVLTVLAPADVANLQRVSSVPAVLAILLVVLAVATLAHALVTSIRRRRRDLAILKTLGLLRRQVSATVAWQATTIAIIATLVGAPLGVATGRMAWTFFATHSGIVPSPAVPALLVALALPATLAAANVLATVPGRSAARTRPALVLRTE
jgi:predicted lysophospholipase L1 biosynthesis ABC-type transport system permease subunit